MRERISRSLALFVLLAGVAVPRQSALAIAPRPCAIPNFPAPILCARAGLDTVHATFIIMVDESGSMAPLWPTVKQALAEFAQAVPDGDELDVRLFSGSVRSLIAPVPATDRVRAGWVGSIRSLQSPGGSSTDLGRAAKIALSQIGSAPADRVQFLFFLTDGQQDPDATSSFPASWGGDWRSLASQAAVLVASRPVSLAIIRLTSSADRSLLTRALPTAVLTDAIGPDALRDWFARMRREVAVAKLTTLINRELTLPVARVESKGRLVVHSDRYESHEVSVVHRRRILETLPVDDSPVKLPGGGAFVPSADIWSENSGSILMSGAAYGPWVRPGSLPRLVDGRIAIHTRLEPKDELQRIGISAGARTDTLQVKLALLAGGPLTAWLYYGTLVFLAFVVAVIARAVRRAAHRAHLDGRVIVRNADAKSTGETHVFRGRQLQTYTIASVDGRELIRLDARNEKGRTVVYATPVADDVTLRGKPLRVSSALTGKSLFAASGDEVTYLLT